MIGTPRGLYRWSTMGFVNFGPPVRVNALAVSDRKLWLGAPDGVYELDGLVSRWHPLVFGPRASSTNVVMALAAWKKGVLALTDNGGLVDVQPGTEVSAHRFIEPRANEGNPGAAVVTGDTALFGTQGGGMLVVRGDEVARPRGWSLPTVTALSNSTGRVLAGTETGEVFELSAGPTSTP